MTSTTYEGRGPLSRAPRLVGFRRHLHVATVPGDATYLFSEQGGTALRGPHIEALAPLLDGTRDLPSLLRAAPAGTTAGHIGALIGELEAAGLLTYRPAGSTDGRSGRRPAEAYWDLAGIDASEACDRVSHGQAQVLVLGGMSRRDVMRACAATGLHATVLGRHDVRPAAEASVTLVICDDYLDPRLREVDEAHRADGRPWLLAKPRGSAPWVGPLFRPGESACWNCLAYRLHENRSAELTVRRCLGATGPAPLPDASLPAGRALALNAALLETAKWLAGYRYPGQDSLHVIDTLAMEQRPHRVVRRPQCPQCGDVGLVAARTREPVALTSRPKTAGAGGGHRALSPRQVLDRYRHLVSPLTGAVREVEREATGPENFHTYLSGLNPAAGAAGSPGPVGLRERCGGKGATALDAEAGALCEALERYSGRFHGDEPRTRDTLRGLGEAAMHPNALQLFHERQFRNRTAWNAANSAFQHVCEPFDESVPIDWTPVWSLTRGSHRLLPTGLLYFDVPRESARGFTRADSNGNAAGSSLEDAVLQGFLELVERDAVALWWYNRTRQPAIDLGAFGDPWLDEAREAYGRLHRELWALDLTSDFGIPVFVALSRRSGPAGGPQDIVFGFGAHFDPRLALRRAVTELNQFLPAVLDPPPGGARYRGQETAAVDWWREATTANQPYLLPDPGETPRTPGCFGYVPRADLLDDIHTAHALVRELGLELMVLNQTRPDIGLPVVKVIVPGLRSFWARFAPGRLFEIPVRLGRLTAAKQYDEINPIPLFV